MAQRARSPAGKRRLSSEALFYADWWVATKMGASRCDGSTAGRGVPDRSLLAAIYAAGNATTSFSAKSAAGDSGGGWRSPGALTNASGGDHELRHQGPNEFFKRTG